MILFYKRLLQIGVCLFIIVGQVMAQSDPHFSEYAMERYHNSDTIFFEWIEDGIGGQLFVAIKFNANEFSGGTKTAECSYNVYYINKKNERTELTMNHFSTTDDSIKNLSISPKSVSFDIDLGFFEPSGDTRQIRFVATRLGSSSSTYQANGVANALWVNMFDHKKTFKVELKQVPSITLPYPIGD